MFDFTELSPNLQDFVHADEEEALPCRKCAESNERAGGDEACLGSPKRARNSREDCLEPSQIRHARHISHS